MNLKKNAKIQKRVKCAAKICAFFLSFFAYLRFLRFSHFCVFLLFWLKKKSRLSERTSLYFVIFLCDFIFSQFYIILILSFLNSILLWFYLFSTLYYFDSIFSQFPHLTNIRSKSTEQLFYKLIVKIFQITLELSDLSMFIA